MTIAAIAYIVVTAPLLFLFYATIGKRFSVHATLWRCVKVLVSLVALSILWVAILHVGEAGRENPFGYIFSAFYAIIIGFVYVAADRSARQS